jgi:ferredoxin/flavodoxin---NADP+ reductase
VQHRVLEVKSLPGAAFLLRLERNGLEFAPGQHLTLGRSGSGKRREYTVYSSPREDDLQFLIKDVPGGDVSSSLHRCKREELLEVEGPFGTFTIPTERLENLFLFVATGTGIAPFHCFVKSHPHLRYQVLHGARHMNCLYGRESFDPRRYTSCLSRGRDGGFFGRVTDHLKQNPPEPSTHCYLCGSADMIFEVFAILREYGVARDHLFAEIYF